MELILGVFGISWVLPQSIADLLFGWWNGLGRHESNVWNLVPLCLIWIVWKERNSHTSKMCQAQIINFRNALCLSFLSGLKCRAILLARM